MAVSIRPERTREFETCPRTSSMAFRHPASPRTRDVSGTVANRNVDHVPLGSGPVDVESTSIHSPLSHPNRKSRRLVGLVFPPCVKHDGGCKLRHLLTSSYQRSKYPSAPVVSNRDCGDPSLPLRQWHGACFIIARALRVASVISIRNLIKKSSRTEPLEGVRPPISEPHSHP